jgi:hypothetical protein
LRKNVLAPPAPLPLSELDQLARRFAGERHDGYSERALARAYEEFLSRRRTPIAPFVISVDGREVPNFYALLAEPEGPIVSADLRLDPVPEAGLAWEFLQPFERIVVHPDGSADLHPLVPGPPTRAIYRLLLREHYLPRSRSDMDRSAVGGQRVELAGYLGTLEQSLSGSRKVGLLPFSAAVMLYSSGERIPYELDLVRNTLLADPRAGRLPAAKRVKRIARISWSVDRMAARGDLTLLAARALEMVVESNGLTALELAHIFGGGRELLDSALQSLVARNLVTFDHRTNLYRPRLEAFLPSPGPRAPTQPLRPAGTDPALRTSVQELIAAADARATCPLCGAPLPPGPKSILCADCTAKVGAA